MATHVRPTYRRHYLIVFRYTWQLSAAPSPPVQSEFHDRDAKYTKIYDKWDDFDIVNFPFIDGDVLRRPSYGVYIYLNSFALPEHLHMLLTSIIVTNS